MTDLAWQTRCDLAAAYRWLALHGWDDLVFTPILVRVPGPEAHLSINPAGFLIHSAIHAARHDTHCVMHTHTPDGIAVSAQESGLQPLSQQAIFPLASLSDHDDEGVVLHEAEQGQLAWPGLLRKLKRVNPGFDA